MLLLYLIFIPEELSDSSSLQEILWNFCHSKDKKKRLSLKENAHFYTELPTLLKSHGDSVKIDPTEDFRHADNFYVLIDRPQRVHIMTGNKILHSFGNLWRSENTIIFKGSGIFFFAFVFPPVSDLSTEICGRLMGESIVNASLRGTYSEFYVKMLPVSRFSTGVPNASGTRNHRRLQPIETELYPMDPWTGWEHFIDSPPVDTSDSSVDFCFCVFTERATPGPNSPVRSNVITYASTDIDVVAGPLSTNV